MVLSKVNPTRMGKMHLLNDVSPLLSSHIANAHAPTVGTEAKGNINCHAVLLKSMSVGAIRSIVAKRQFLGREPIAHIQPPVEARQSGVAIKEMLNTIVDAAFLTIVYISP